MSERKWTPAQAQCINSYDGTLLVSAAAGSGKTAVLVERIIRRITDEHAPLDLDRILVVTFTNAAAAGMRSRLSSALSEQLVKHPDDGRLLHQQLMLPRASISTVHSFCIQLIRENFHALDISAQFKIADEQQLALMRKDILREVITQCYEEQHPDFLELCAMLTNGKNDSHLLSAIESIYAFIQSYPDPERWLSDTADAYSPDVPVAETVWGRYILQQVRDSLLQCKRLTRVAINAAGDDEVLLNNYVPALQSDLDFIEHACTLCEHSGWDALFNELDQYTPLPFRSSKGCTNPSGKDTITALRADVKARLGKLPDLRCGTEAQCRDDLERSSRLIRMLYAMVRRFADAFAAQKRAANVLDFNDAEHFALKLLTTRNENGELIPSQLATDLSDRFDEILVDEYQDTNAVQDALFIALSRNQQNLFMVGDVKQSIYSFRKAMPELFIGRRNRYPLFDGNHYPGTILLGNNFRSRRGVTEAVNFVFRQLMCEGVGGISYDDREALVCSASYPEQDGCEPECLIVDESQYDSSMQTADQAEARVIAERIRELKGSFEITEDGKTRPLEYGDCCILLRSYSQHATAYRDALIECGIPCIAQTATPFLETAEIRLALSLLRCIDNPLLDIPLTAVLLSPLFGFSPDDLAAIRLYRPKVPLYVAVSAARRHDDASLSTRCSQFVQTIDRYRTLSGLLTVDRLLGRLYEETALPELVCARFGKAGRAENLRVLHEQCTHFEQGGFRGLSAFIRHIDRLQEQGISLPGASADDTQNAVRIMSVHGSKGLEFPVVFVAGLGRAFNNENTRQDLLLHTRHGAGINLRDPETLNRHNTVARQGILLMQRDDNRAEELRVLYVALTRAREKLCLVTSLKHPAKRLGNLCAMLEGEGETLSPALIRDADSLGDWIVSALLRHPSATLLRHLAGAPDSIVPLPDENEWVFRVCCPPPIAATKAPETITIEPDPARVDIIREHMDYVYPHTALARIPTKLAASQISADVTLPELVAHARPAFMSRAGLTPAERGTAMHNFMQFCNLAAAAQSTEREAERLTAEAFLSVDAANALDHRRLAAFFRSELYARMRNADRLLREYHFTYRREASTHDPAVTDQNEVIVIQGTTDCVLVEDGALVIVDYKTDRVRYADQLIERYAPQLATYAHALSTVLGLPVKECLLYSFELGQTVKIP